MKQLIIVRGPCGGGKTTFAAGIQGVANGPCFEADMYFIRDDGVYDFNPRLLKNAHEWCYRRVAECIEAGENCIVANTFTRIWEMQKYIDLVKEMNAELVVYRCTGRYKNVHGVPEDKVRAMHERMEDFEGEILIGEKND